MNWPLLSSLDRQIGHGPFGQASRNLYVGISCPASVSKASSLGPNWLLVVEIAYVSRLFWPFLTELWPKPKRFWPFHPGGLAIGNCHEAPGGVERIAGARRQALTDAGTSGEDRVGYDREKQGIACSHVRTLIEL
jgi:hypothetical protein